MKNRGRKERRKGGKVQKGKKGIWTVEGRKKFEEYFGLREETEEGIEEEWKNLRKE